jgi:hypothetical protein
VRVATLLALDKQVVRGPWDHRTISAPGAVLPMAIPGTTGIGVFLEVEVEPDDYSPQQVDVWIYVRGLDTRLENVTQAERAVSLVPEI